MKIFKPVLAFAFFAFAIASQAADVDAKTVHAYSQLKAFRTYFLLGASSPEQERFEVYFVFKQEYHHVSLAAKNVRDISNIMPEQLLKLADWGGLSLPPAEEPKIPSGKENYVTAIRSLMNQVSPAVNDVKIFYTGRFATVTMKEVIPTSGTDVDVKDRLARNAYVTYQYSRGSPRLKPYGLAIYGQGAVLPLFERPSYGTHFIDFSLSPANEGHSLLYSQDIAQRQSRNPEALRADWLRFEAATEFALKGDLEKTGT